MSHARSQTAFSLPSLENLGESLRQGTLLAVTNSADAKNFRKEIRGFLRDQVPPELAKNNFCNNHPKPEDLRFWARVLHENGWAAPQWPKEFGGRALTPAMRLIFEEECALAGAPSYQIQGLNLIGPMIQEFGTEEQKARFLPKILTGAEIWAQGFSEPEAGSDLASVRTTATWTGSAWKLTGTKIWTSQAHFADRLYCLVRTDPGVKPQQGLTIMVVDPKGPGVTIRPIIGIDGHHSLNQIFLDEVIVPPEDVIGAPGNGWVQAKALLKNERAWAAEVPQIKLRLLRLCRAADPGNRPRLGAVLAELEAETFAVEAMTFRALQEGQTDNWPAGNLLKIRGSELQQAIGDRQLENMATITPTGTADPYGMTTEGMVADILYKRATSIYGGANEVQRDIVAHELLSSSVPLVSGGSSLHAEFFDTASRLLDRSTSKDGQTLWSELAGLGWFEFVDPFATTARYSDDAILAIAEAMGRHLSPQPFLASAVGPLRALAACTTHTAKSLQQKIIDAERYASYCFSRNVGASDAAQILLLAPVTEYTDCILFHDRHGEHGDVLRLIRCDAPGVERRTQRTLDGAYGLGVNVSAEAFRASDIIAQGDEATWAVALAEMSCRHAAAAWVVGAAARAIESTRDYIHCRTQFNKTLSTFQAVRHRMADMYSNLEAARSAFHYASELQPPERQRAIDAAYLSAIKGAAMIIKSAIQLHGAIGVTNEILLGRQYKSLLTIQTLYGTEPELTWQLAGAWSKI